MPVQKTTASTIDTPEFQAVFTQSALIVFIILLLGETTINYIDRQVVSVLAPTLKAEFSMNNSQYAMIVNAFLFSYAISYALAGWVLDKVGVGRGLTLSIGWWSIADMATALARGPMSLGWLRGILGVGEAGAWPAFAKSVATWVPPEARMLAIGICNSGSSLGAVLAPPMVAWITLTWGWRWAFVVTGLLGVVWTAAFLLFRRRHPEMAIAENAPKDQSKRIKWLSLLGYRQTWAVFFCRFLADPLWYFFVFWIPEFLSKERGLNLKSIGAVAWIPFLVAGIGNFTAGYISLRLQRAGWSVNRTRKTMMVIAVILSPVAIIAVYLHSLFWTIALVSVSIFFWIFWAVAVHCLPGDYFPPRAVGSVYGIAGAGSAFGTVITQWAVGAWLDKTADYTMVFIGLSLLMPVAMLVGFTLMKKVEPVQRLAA